MVEPRKPNDIQRIIKQAKSETGEADLREYDRLLAERINYDPSLETTGSQQKAKLMRERRLRWLERRLLAVQR
jgi:hypothetical protein